MNKWISVFLLAFCLSCASDNEKNLEKARFLLDEGRFAEAIELVAPIVEDDPDNDEAKFILASALIGNFALSPKPGCQEEDVGYLGTLACLLDDTTGEDLTGFQTFGRIAPEQDDLNEQIFLAVELLESITEFTKDILVEDVALQRLIARSFAISTLYQKVGVNSENSSCNLGGPGVDQVPDDYDSTVITDEDATLFRDNLEGIEIDSALAGLGDDFPLLTRASQILDNIDAVPLTLRESLAQVFDDSYNSPEQQVCN